MKKLLYQLEEDYSCDFTPFFDEITLGKFRSEVISDIVFFDHDDRKVMTIKSSCQIIVHKGYRWDGCSPKINILNLFWLGTPDGLVIGSERKVNNKDEEQNIPIKDERITHYASVVHDVLGYCKRDTQMPSLFRAYGKDLWLSPGRNARDKLFLQLLGQKEFIFFKYIYYVAIVLFAPLYDFLSGLKELIRPK